MTRPRRAPQLPLALAAAAALACHVQVGPSPPEPRAIASLGVAGAGNVYVNGARASHGQAVREGDEVSTGPGSSAWIALSDGGHFQLDEDTDPIFVFKRIGEAWCLLVRMVRGQAYGDRRRTCIETPNGAGEAGSAFNIVVSAAAQTTEITVYEGHVDFRGIGEGNQRGIAPGERVVFRDEAAPELSRLVTLAPAPWRAAYRFDAWCCDPSGEVVARQPGECPEGPPHFRRIDALRRCSAAAPAGASKPIPTPAPAPAAPQFAAAPETIRAGEAARLCYAVDPGARARIDPGIGAVEVGGGERCLEIRPRATTTFTLTVERPGREPVVRRAAVRVRPAEAPAPGQVTPTTPGRLTPSEPAPGEPGRVTPTTPSAVRPGAPTTPSGPSEPPAEGRPEPRPPADLSHRDPSPAPTKMSTRTGYNLPGHDYDHFAEPGGPAACARRCLAEARCRAFTYAAPGAREKIGTCWLKGAVPKAAVDERCTSGVKEPIAD